MMFLSTVDFQRRSDAGMNNFITLLYGFFKFSISRKCGSICRICLVVILLFSIYLASTYITFPKGNSYTPLNGSSNTDFQVNPDVKSTENVPRIHIPNEVVIVPSHIKVGDIILNCGLHEACNDGEFSVHIYTGKDHSDEPRLCIDGKYILSKSVNGGGRGINVVVVDNLTRVVIKVSHFDTYEKESTALETLLLTLRPGDIIILFTFDEPTRKLSRVARLLLYELGSALIQNLSYRGSWYMVTQKGLSGFSPFEELHLVGASGWPKHHSVRLCIPFSIKGQLIHPDAPPRINQHRVEFCQKHQDYPMFCDADVINDPLIASPIVKHSSSSSKIYNTPVIVMSSENILYLPLTLETIVRQSGVNPSLVVVFYLPQHADIPKLCELFGFMSEELTQSHNYCEQVKEAFETANLLFPDAKELLFIGSNVILAPDFLLYMGQLLSLLTVDSSILSISAFNDNGYHDISGDPTLLYRVETFSGLSMLIRRNFFHKSWCSSTSDADTFAFMTKIKGHNIVPDVSRILPLPIKKEQQNNSTFYSAVMKNERVVNYDENIRLKDVGKLIRGDYEHHLSTRLAAAVSLTVDFNTVQQCAKQRSKSHFNNQVPSLITFINSNITGQTVAIYFHQSNKEDVKILQLFCECFGLFYHRLYSPRGLYKNLLRFSLHSKQMFLVGSASPFYRYKPLHSIAVPVADQSSPRNDAKS